MIKTLCLDFGNTRLKGAIFYEDKLQETFILNGDAVVDVSFILEKYQPAYSILSSVVNHTAKWRLLKTDESS